jgi:hypothetical protein
MKHGRLFLFYAIFFAIAATGSLSLADSGGIHWNQQITPGKLCTAEDPYFDSFVYPAHVAHCIRHVTDGLKKQVADAYGVPESAWSSFEFDHLIPLCAGGTNSPLNLWPEPLAHAHVKDRIENKMCLGLRDGKIDQQQALKILWDWLSQNPETLTVNSAAFVESLLLPVYLR